MSDEDLAAFFEKRMKIDMSTNQYLFIENAEGKVVHKQKWNREDLVERSELAKLASLIK